MPAYSKEKQQEQIARIRQIMVLMPNASNETIGRKLKENNYSLDRKYISKLVKKIVSERTARYNVRTKEMALSKFEDLIDVMSDVLKKIFLSETASNMDKTVAIGQLVKQNKLIIDMMMDMGLLERYLGKLTHEVSTADILKIIEDAKHNNKNDQGGENKNNNKVDA